MEIIKERDENMWEQRDKTLKTIADVVHKNTGLTDEELLHDTKEYKIKGTDKVVEKLKEAKEKNIPITIVGDYDCDGVSATSVLILLFRYMHIDYRYILPKRFKEGYGLKDTIVDRIDKGILITVDNGIVAFDAVKKAKDKGLYVIITDHHARHPSGKLPDADIIIDPATLPGTADYQYYCGAGIAYKIAEEALGKKHPLLKKLSAIASFGTVADMVPLLGDNRKIVAAGLKNIFESGGRTMGMYKLLDKMYIKNQMTSTDISFGVGPAINAAGRLEGTQVSYTKFNEKGEEEEVTTIADATMGVEILTNVYKDFTEAENAVDDLVNINNARKRLKKEQFKIVMDYIDDNAMYGDAPMVVYCPGLHLGIVGILAGELTEKFGVPAIVLTDDPTNIENIKGSARSIPRIDLKALLDKHADDMVTYGGHPGAAGLTIERSKLDEFREHLNEELYGEKFEPEKLKYDLEIQEKDVESCLDELSKYGPFGQGNPEPLFLIRSFRLYPNGGTMFEYKGDEHVIMQGAYTKANAFFLQEKFKEIDDPTYLDIVCTLGKSWDKNGNSIPTLFIEDLQKAEKRKEKKRTTFFEEMEKTINQKGALVF